MTIFILNVLNRVDYKKWFGVEDNIYMLCKRKHKGQYEDIGNVIYFENFEYSPFKFLQKTINPKEETYLIGTSEYDLLDLARLRDSFGLKGQKEQSALAFRDKVVMKDIVSKVIKTPFYKRLENKFDVWSFVNKHGFPVVIKPVDGAGSVDTFVVNTEKELDNTLDKVWCNNLMIETFVSGDMYHIDGIFSKDKLLLSRPSKYINGCLAYQENKYLGSVLLDEDNPLYERLNNNVETILKEMPTDKDFPTVFHCELFYTQEKEIVFCEIASRVGGGKIVETLQEVTGTNLLKEWVKGQAGKPITYEDKKSGSGGWIFIPSPSKGKVKQVSSLTLPDWVIYEEIRVKENDVIDVALASVDYIAAFVVKGENQQDVKTKLTYLNEMFLQSLIYEKDGMF